MQIITFTFVIFSVICDSDVLHSYGPSGVVLSGNAKNVLLRHVFRRGKGKGDKCKKGCKKTGKKCKKACDDHDCKKLCKKKAKKCKKGCKKCKKLCKKTFKKCKKACDDHDCKKQCKKTKKKCAKACKNGAAAVIPAAVIPAAVAYSPAIVGPPLTSAVPYNNAAIPAYSYGNSPPTANSHLPQTASASANGVTSAVPYNNAAIPAHASNSYGNSPPTANSQRPQTASASANGVPAVVNYSANAQTSTPAASTIPPLRILPKTLPPLTSADSTTGMNYIILISVSFVHLCALVV